MEAAHRPSFEGFGSINLLDSATGKHGLELRAVEKPLKETSFIRTRGSGQDLNTTDVGVFHSDIAHVSGPVCA